MANITAQMVKDLRDLTGAGMMDCKAALGESGGNVDAAVDWLRKKGLSKAAKKSGRVAAEGLVGVSTVGNVGAVMRTAACLGVALDLIEPMGFQWDDKRVARAAMDYIDHVSVTRHADCETFQGQATGRLVLLTTAGNVAYTDFAFRPTDTLLLGRESAGVPDEVHEAVDGTDGLRLRVPLQKGARSLNVALAASMVLSEALRQTSGYAQLT